MFMLEYGQEETMSDGRTKNNYMATRWHQHAVCDGREPLEKMIDGITAKSGGCIRKEQWRITEIPHSTVEGVLKANGGKG
jgi:hypothetical protein